jgi:hypothetical protein
VNTSTDTEVQTYLDRLRGELAGLPAAEIEEIVQDVEPQVTAMAAGLDGDTLTDRLGDPAEYARELRNALGMPDEPAQRRPPRWFARTGLAVLVATTVTACVAGYLTGQIHSDDARYALLFLIFGLFASWLAVGRDRTAMREIAALPELGLVRTRLATADRRLPVTAYLTSVRPGLRLVKAAFAWLGTVWLFGWFGWLGAGGATIAIVGAVITVAAGYRAERDPRWLWLSIPLSGWALGVAIEAMAALPPLASGHI